MVLSKKRAEYRKLAAYMTVSQAATFLGVSTPTLRNWDRQGKLVAQRHPLNKYRLYRREDLERLLESIRSGDGEHGQ